MTKKKLTFADYLTRLKKSLYLPETQEEKVRETAQIALESYRYEKEKYKENLRLFANNVTKNWLYPRNNLEILKYVDSRFFTRVLTYFCFLYIIERLKIKTYLRLDLDSRIRFIMTDVVHKYLSTKKTKKKAYSSLTKLEIIKMQDDFIANFWQNMIILDYVKISPGGYASLNTETTKLMFDTFLMEAFKDYPTIIPPKSWDREGQNGGYFVNTRALLKPNDEFAGNVVVSERLVNIINHMQGIPWTYDIPEYCLNSEFKYQPQALMSNHLNTDIQQRLHVYFFLKEFMPKVNSIYFPYQIDFRGRIYPIPASFSPESSKKLRAYLRTTTQYALTEEGVSWLRLYLANVLGLNKDTYLESMQSIKNIDNIEVYIDNLKDEYQKYLSQKIINDIKNNHSNLLVQFDATSSVFQILSILFNSKDLMYDTNVYSEKANILSTQSEHEYKDIYLKVLELAKETAPFEGLSLLLTRKFVKPITMTFAYGAAEQTGRDQIIEYLEMIEDKYKNSKGKEYKEEFNLFWSISDEDLLKHASPTMKQKYQDLLTSSKHDDIWEYRRLLYATIFHRHIISIIYKLYPILEDFKHAFIEPGSEYQHATFKNPYLEFDNIYYKTKRYIVYGQAIKPKNKTKKVKKVNRRIELSFRKILTDQINAHSLAAGANYVHSLDAFILYYIIENKPKDCPIFTIHDCILIRPIDVPLFLELIKEAYIQIQNIAKEHPFFSKYHEKGSIPIESYSMFKIEYANE